MLFNDRATELVASCTRTIARGFAGVVASLVLAAPTQAGGTQLTAIEVTPRDGQGLEVRLKTTGPAPRRRNRRRSRSIDRRDSRSTCRTSRWR
jgi:hypothetical protein